ncbi:hypothetical protein I7I51_00253 [Histoplasma capsulatum]|uniref:Uncharacterized protein n=1 Tax=Ajellomyces capsulatus TaxID=5037 RepID=A0A8A1M9L0_AJECA|nr:hypothetical protein I7I51_00253 [Histoplasma capsulatum]
MKWAPLFANHGWLSKATKASALVLSINIQLLREWNKWRVVAILCFRPELLTSYASQLKGTPSTVWPQLEIVHQQPTCWLRLNHSDVRYIPETPGPFLLVVFQAGSPFSGSVKVQFYTIYTPPQAPFSRSTWLHI